MNVQVDAERCQGHTLCNMIAPEVFGLSDEDGHATVLMQSIPGSLRERARRASMNCPELAISVTTDDEDPSLALRAGADE